MHVDMKRINLVPQWKMFCCAVKHVWVAQSVFRYQYETFQTAGLMPRTEMFRTAATIQKHSESLHMPKFDHMQTVGLRCRKPKNNENGKICHF